MKKMMVLALGAAMAVVCGCGEKDNSLKMITEATFPPYEFLRGSEIVGIDVEICKAVAAKLGKTFAVENVDFDSVIPSVMSGKADIAAAGITVTEDRKKNVDFSDVYAKTEIVLIYKKSAPVLTAADCKGKRIGVQGGNTAETIVIEQFKQEPERFRSAAEACAALKAGRCEAGEELRPRRGRARNRPQAGQPRRVCRRDQEGPPRAAEGDQRDDRRTQGERQNGGDPRAVHEGSRRAEEVGFRFQVLGFSC